PPRLWWCPTGPFSFLPIHAAGIYGKDMTDCVSDYVVSSYTPTLTAMLGPPSHAAPAFKITAVLQPNTKGCDPLPGALQELKRFKRECSRSGLLRCANCADSSQESSIAHFACHGIQDLKQPLDSGLMLRDGERLKVLELMRRPEGGNAFEVPKTMALGFLSACETAKGDRTVPDEAMHLAATLLFAGFRGVVATMWFVDFSFRSHFCMISDTSYQDHE
ncbi:CHAT domain-containing protein, partial [Mycena olivaceomarginata]